MDDAPIRLLLVDDERSIREPLSEFLLAQGFDVFTAADAAEARRLLKSERFDIAVSDIMMPGEDGLSLARHLSTTAGLPVILLTARTQEDDRVTGLNIGADDYIPKPFGPRELVARIHAVLRRAGQGSDQSGRRGDGGPATGYRFAQWTLLPHERMIVDADGRRVELSSGEYGLLDALVRHPRQILSRDRLLDLVRGRDADNLDRAIDNLISRLRRKLGDNARKPTLVRTIWGGGYSLHADVERVELP